MAETKNDTIATIVDRYDGDDGMLIPMLQDLQAEYGYLPADELKALSKRLGAPLSRLYSIAMFYSSFRLAPKGAHEVTLCMGTVCHLKGAPKIRQAICEEYNIEPGETTADRLFTLQGVNCVGACALAPVMIVDDTYYDGVTPEKALKILKKLSPEEPEADSAPKSDSAADGESGKDA